MRTLSKTITNREQPRTRRKKTDLLLEEKLKRPFSDKQIKERTIINDRGEAVVLQYVPGNKVVERLNEAFNFMWSFEIIEATVNEKQGQIYVLGQLSAEIDGQRISKQQYGGCRIARWNNGFAINLGDDMKIASTDALKKCATLFGVGLHLYDNTDRGDETIVTTPALKTSEDDDKIASVRANLDGNAECSKVQLETLFTIVMDSKNVGEDEAEQILKQVFNVDDVLKISKKDAAMSIIRPDNLLGKIKEAK